MDATESYNDMNEAGLVDGPESGSARGRGRRAAKNSNEEVKARLSLNVGDSHPLAHFMQAVKERGIKNLDLGEFVLEALLTIPEAWWQQKLEDYTPLEYKINAALSDPAMREKLTSLLASTTLANGKNAASLPS